MPCVVIRPILLLRASVNHSAPSEPAAMPQGSFVVGWRRKWKFSDQSTRGNAADLAVAALLGEPQISVGSRRDAGRNAAGRGNSEFRDGRLCAGIVQAKRAAQYDDDGHRSRPMPSRTKANGRRAWCPLSKFCGHADIQSARCLPASASKISHCSEAMRADGSARLEQGATSARRPCGVASTIGQVTRTKQCNFTRVLAACSCWALPPFCLLQPTSQFGGEAACASQQNWRPMSQMGHSHRRHPRGHPCPLRLR